MAESSWTYGLFADAPWAPTRALGRAVLLSGVLVVFGVLFHRSDFMVLAAPFAVGVAWGLRRLPTVSPSVSVAVAAEVAGEGGEVELTVTVANPTPVALDAVVVRFDHSRWVSVPHSDRPYATALRPGRTNQVELTGTALRWGRQRVGPVTAYAVAAGGLLVSGRAVGAAQTVRVHPQRPPFRADEAMPRSSALVGVHRSRRPGEGGELAGVRRYGSGDKLRRIDWRVTLRTRELYVSHMLSDRDAEVVVLLDVVQDAGRSGGLHGAPSVVDTSVRAAAAIAEHYLRQGDRVSLLEYSGHPRQLAAGSGRRHLTVAAEWLLATRAAAGAGDHPGYGFDSRLVPNAALVVVLSPILDPKSADMIATLARAGRTVVVVDTLTDGSTTVPTDSEWTGASQLLWRTERESIIDQLRQAGVPVAPWVGSGSFDQVLRAMTVLAAAPRLGPR